MNYIEERAREIQKDQGGKIFSFPVHEEDPYSKYAIVIDTGENLMVYPNSVTIEEAAACIKSMLEALKDQGLDHDYNRLVRMVSYDAQFNSPNVTMRKLRKDEKNFMSSGVPLMKEGEDFYKRDDGEEGLYINARGLIKFSYLEMLDKNKNGDRFMRKYYELLSSKRYGKTASAIQQEVRRMDRLSGIRWIEKTYKGYIKNDNDVLDIMKSMI
ncbi:hypothetical protein [Paenibacillus qinlingensis]|uniref:HEPN domain-containing protein n=1 Tax=Paenibacillus qinlingensis TaxID=1837343 RepID=A0ABU1P6V0_9BACL|nr:hypothetical protein [Paenibacillus qinlingensis]MDR6555493.1 HEPN domain-containing protein [Paenibacillus qinlingensis]